MVDISKLFQVFINRLITGGPHIVGKWMRSAEFQQEVPTQAAYNYKDCQTNTWQTPVV